ncbi:hypothetical protein BCIN_01g07940 [Botrytis cinerea B05.10]|uniref:Uncharacterized protein n=1 Tax=Botryotinia fuckeliana (strain B05.10) TaxID=332648 RepID=A0A384J6R4_BOTFB|nr:hypothetical protein BCIN_01g07940 [Botrytis cinerea B05.10]ATZ46141.1 hypothetical protein BCIN_01g07940 [Botrytis cinerea B05.10]
MNTCVYPFDNIIILKNVYGEAYFRKFLMWRTMVFFRLTISMKFDQEEMEEFIMALDWQTNTCMENLLAGEYSTALHQRSFLRTHVLLLSEEAPLSHSLCTSGKTMLILSIALKGEYQEEYGHYAPCVRSSIKIALPVLLQ